MTNHERSFILSIDCGSSSVRCSIWHSDGIAVDDIHAQHPVSFDDEGHADAEETAQATEAAIDDCLRAFGGAGLPGHIVGVGWASFAMSLLGVDAGGNPVTPVFTYADRTSGEYADQLRIELEENDVLHTTCQRTGTPIHSAYAPAQMLRLQSEEPDRHRAVAFWQTLSSYLLARWTGRPSAPISSSEAGWTGLFDRARWTWDEFLLDRLGVDRSHLPDVLDYSDSVEGLSEEYAARWPELRTVPFFLAVGDGAAANIGSGCSSPERIALTIGTSGALRIVVPSGPHGPGNEKGDPGEDRPPLAVPSGLWCYPVSRKQLLLGGALTDGGSLFDWLRETLRGDEETLLAQADKLQPDEHGLTVLPFLRGERSPGWATKASLTINGINSRTTPAHLLRAGLESVALRFHLIEQKLQPYLADEAAVFVSGGALQVNPLWRQILADVLDREVHLTAVSQSTSRGAVLLAAGALGLPASRTHAHIIATSHPRRDAHEAYRRALSRQEALYEKFY